VIEPTLMRYHGLMGRGVLIAVCLAVAAAACDKSTDPVPVPTTIAKPTTTEAFTGTVAPFGSFQYQFKVNVDSEVHITLVSLTTIAVQADPTADPPVVAKPAVNVSYPLNVRVGQTTITTLGIACTNLKHVMAAPGSSPQLTGQALAGTYCVDVSDDSGALPETVTIKVTIAHS